MGRRNIYFKEKTEQEVLELVQIEMNSATHGEVNFSSVVNEPGRHWPDGQKASERRE
jgi:hypothetical protein